MADTDVLDRDDVEELPPYLQRQIAPRAIAPAAVAPPAAPPAKSITGAPPVGTQPPPSITGAPAMPPAPAPDVLGATPGGPAPIAGPNAAQDALSGNVAPPQWKDYKPAHVSAGRRIAGALVGGLEGLKNPQAGGETARSIAFGPQLEKYGEAEQEYKDLLGQGERAQKSALDEANIAHTGAETGELNAKAETEKEGGSLVPFTDESGKTTQVPLSKWGPLEIERERAAELQKSTETKGQTAKDIAATTTGSREHEGEANRQNQLQIATMRDHLEDIISGRRESTAREIAGNEYGTPDRDLGAAPAGKKEGSHGTLPDGTKVTVKGGRIVAPGQQGTRTSGAGGLSAQNKGRAEFAKTVTDQVPIINSEIDALSSKIGPGAGRWEQFWVNKGGANDPDFAGLDQDLGLYASAVAVTHFGARGGGQHFIEALKKDFSEAQSPDDLKARIASANKWLTGYANMGQKK